MPVQRRLILGLALYELFVISAVAYAGIAAGGGSLVAAIPVLVVAASEALRVPLSAWATRLSFLNRVLALLVLGCLALASAEGLALSFDNLIAARTRVVSAAAKRVDVAAADLAAARQRAAPEQSRLEAAQTEITQLDAQQRALIASPPAAPAISNIVCRTARGSTHSCPADATAQRTYATARADYSRQLSSLEEQRHIARSQVEAAQRALRAIDIAGPTATVLLANRDYADALEASPMHRIAASWFGVRAVELTERQFSIFRKYAVTGLSLALASMSALVAWLAFQPEASHEPNKLSRSLRAYIARRRKAVVRKVEVPSGVKIIYRYVPVPAESKGPMGPVAFTSEKISAYEELCHAD